VDRTSTEQGFSPAQHRLPDKFVLSQDGYIKSTLIFFNQNLIEKDPVKTWLKRKGSAVLDKASDKRLHPTKCIYGDDEEALIS
jgi:hypothetical protein